MSQCHDTYDEPAGHGCSIDEERTGDVVVARVRGRLDWATADHVVSELLEAIHCSGLVVDLRDTVTDSAGTAAVIRLLMHRPCPERQVVVVADGVEARVLGALGLEEGSGIERDVPAALERLAATGVRVPAPQG